MRANSVGKTKKGFWILMLVIAVLCVTLGFQKAEAVKKEKSLQAKKTSLLQQSEDEDERKEELEQQKAYEETKQYVEDVAREKLGLVNPGDVILREEE